MGMKLGRNINAKTICKNIAFIAFLFLFVAARPACRPPPNIDCIDLHATVEPGTCVDIPNPCATDGSWAEVDHFRLYQEPAGLFIRGQQGAGGTIDRQICAADTVAPMEDEEVSFLYTKVNRRGRPDYGEGFIHVTTVVENPYFVTASATPANIVLGGSSQLDVDVTGGTPPYTYVWMSDPTGRIDPGEVTLKNPVVAPDVDTTYTVAVTDAEGDDVATDSVLVRVGMGLTVSATPDVIDVGDSSQLQATVVGGTPPYSYSWVPLGNLDDATIPNPVATPVVSTLYTVTVTDAGTNVVTDTADVRVRMAVTATATPDTIMAGDESQLNVSVAGGRGPYTYHWVGADGLDPAHISLPNPIVTPSATTTYDVLVTDALGYTEVGWVAVTVAPQADLQACFTVTPDPPDLGGVHETWDAGCSTGEDLEYRWMFSVPELGPTYDQCYGQGPTGGYLYDSPCSSTDEFSPVLQTVEFGFEGVSGYTRRVTLYIRDPAGNIEVYYQDYDM